MRVALFASFFKDKMVSVVEVQPSLWVVHLQRKSSEETVPKRMVHGKHSSWMSCSLEVHSDDVEFDPMNWPS